MDNLRLILLLIGLVILALIWLLHQPEGSSRRPGASRRDDAGREGRRREPVLANDAGDAEPGSETASSEPQQTHLPDFGDDSPREPRLARTPIDPDRDDDESLPPERDWRDPEPAPGDATKAPSRAGGPSTEDGRVIVTLYVRARGDRRISGLSLLDAAIKAGLRFGEMKIFHRRHRGESRPVFSMANISRPGSFDPAGWNLFETPGVTLFLTLPGPVSALDAWDAMLATGRRLAELLDADLMDDSQCLLTRQRTAQIREQMREYDRRAGLGGKPR